MLLPDLVAGVAGQLGNTARFAVKNGQPVIVHQLGWLTFGPSPDNRAMRVTLLGYDYLHWYVDVHPNAGIGHTSLHIRSGLIVPLSRRIADNAQRIRWHNTWCTRFTAWALQGAMRVELHADTDPHTEQLLALRAEFYPGDIHASNKWGSITVFYDGFPARVEYFTDEKSICERLDGIAEKAAPRRFWQRRLTA